MKEKPEFETVLPDDIEKRSFSIIENELENKFKIRLDPQQAPVIKRVIHTTADFEYAGSLCFSKDAVRLGQKAIGQGTCIVTDTNMGKVGINKKKLALYGGEVFCHMADSDVAVTALEKGTTRASASMDKAAAQGTSLIFAVGNAPTALIRLYELIMDEKIQPALIIGVPVGFVNVVPAKELIMTAGIPYIVSRGRKGGSNVAAAIVNALLYSMREDML